MGVLSSLHGQSHSSIQQYQTDSRNFTCLTGRGAAGVNACMMKLHECKWRLSKGRRVQRIWNVTLPCLKMPCMQECSHDGTVWQGAHLSQVPICSSKKDIVSSKRMLWPSSSSACQMSSVRIRSMKFGLCSAAIRASFSLSCSVRCRTAFQMSDIIPCKACSFKGHGMHLDSCSAAMSR